MSVRQIRLATAMRSVVADLIATAPNADLLQRARQPVLESLNNRLKTNGGWLNLIERAQTRSPELRRFDEIRDRYLAITGGRLQELAREYLDPDRAVELRALPAATVDE